MNTPDYDDGDATGTAPPTFGRILAEWQRAQGLAERTFAQWTALPQPVRAELWASLDAEHREALAFAARASNNPLAWFDDDQDGDQDEDVDVGSDW